MNRGTHVLSTVPVSTIDSYPLYWVASHNNETDTVFLKVFLLDSPAQMKFMQQEPLIGRNEDGLRHIKRRLGGGLYFRDGDGPRKGCWDCITAKITVVRDVT